MVNIKSTCGLENISKLTMARTNESESTKDELVARESAAMDDQQE
jgi:hypothetical protein